MWRLERLIRMATRPIHAVMGTSEEDLHQLIETIADQVSCPIEKPNAYIKALHVFADAARNP
jgi:hypothetical protein